jgi:flagellar hook-associated protein 2
VDGLDLTIHRIQEADDPPVTIGVTRDVENIQAAVEGFVEIYNTAMRFVNDQFRYSSDVGVRPPLMGNSTLTGLAGRLRGSVTGLVSGVSEDATFRSLYAIGIRSGSDGTLTLNGTTFQEALTEDFAAVANLFRPNARFDTEGVEWLSAPLDVDLAGVQHTIEITEAATRARIVGSDIDFSSGITIDGSNDDLRIAVNGVLSERLSIPHGTYTNGDELAAAISAAITDSDDLALLSAGVSFEGDPNGVGHLVFTSTGYGSDQTLRLHNAGGDFASTLGLASALDERVSGTDVVGTIDGLAATGDGQILTGTDADGGTKGLTFRITLEDAGVPATIVSTFSAGAGRVASKSLARLTDPSDGTVSRMGSSLQRVIDDIERNIDRKADQLDLLRQRLVRQYAGLESTHGQLQNQSSFLNAQLGSLGGGFGINKS